MEVLEKKRVPSVFHKSLFPPSLQYHRRNIPEIPAQYLSSQRDNIERLEVNVKGSAHKTELPMTKQGVGAAVERLARETKSAGTRSSETNVRAPSHPLSKPVPACCAIIFPRAFPAVVQGGKTSIHWYPRRMNNVVVEDSCIAPPAVEMTRHTCFFALSNMAFIPRCKSDQRTCIPRLQITASNDPSTSSRVRANDVPVIPDSTSAYAGKVERGGWNLQSGGDDNLKLRVSLPDSFRRMRKRQRVIEKRNWSAMLAFMFGLLPVLYALALGLCPERYSTGTTEDVDYLVALCYGAETAGDWVQ
ncbi:hypothetical protein F5146DRAFT_995609 [Armillaria mellea]|nr:hypothetical protein F5146DRAFT_995609 [Armillaria mellea]